jgi:SPP1 family predicted phage head-tail adaptor
MMPGKLNKRVQVQMSSRVQAQSGEMQTTFVDFGTPLWADIKPLNGRELARAQQLNADISTSIRLRYNPALTEQMRVLYTPEVAKPTVKNVYDILAVIHTDERRRETVLMCSKSTFEGFKTGGSNA